MKSITKKILGSFGVIIALVLTAFAVYLFLFDHRPELKLETGDFFGLNDEIEIQYSDFRKIITQVPVTDGTKLAVDIYIPDSKVSSNEKFPTIMMYQPYGRSRVITGQSLIDRIMFKLSTGQWKPILDEGLNKGSRIFLSQGYAIINVDMRGFGASEGHTLPMSPQLALDGKDVIDWIAQQPWSNGRVGMKGQSYLGWSQLAVAQHKPEALKCIMPALIFAESFTEATKPGGITAKKWLTKYSNLLDNIDDTFPAEGWEEKYCPVVPAVDEDGDGDFIDEVPISYENGTPTYSDHNRRVQHYYAKALEQHKGNLSVSAFLQQKYDTIDAPIKHVGLQTTFYDCSPAYFLNRIRETEIPIYHIGGWFDGFITGTTKLYSSTQNMPNTKLFIAPRFHEPISITQAYAEYFGYKGKYEDQLILESLRFANYHLKGIKNGISSEKPVKIYVMNEGWREESEWPLARQQMKTLYFTDGQKLAPEKTGTEGFDSHNVDWNHSSSYGKNDSNRWVMMDGPETLMDRTDHDKKTFTYTTLTLQEDLEVTGHPIVNIWLSANHADADLHVFLTDVDVNGRSLYVTEGHLRAGWADLYNDDDQVLETVDINPDLPWHGYKTEQFDNTRLENGKIIQMRLDLFPTSWVFKKGHKIRIAISGADKDNFDLNTTACPNNQIDSDLILNFHRSKDMWSNIELPIIP